MKLPETQEEIRSIYTQLKTDRDKIDKELKVLRTICEHPNATQGDYLARKGWKKCGDCGFWDEWWLA